jgi:hypothetical protein
MVSTGTCSVKLYCVQPGLEVKLPAHRAGLAGYVPVKRPPQE